MPDYHDLLYYVQKQTGTVYSDTASGIIDVERLIKGKKYWKNPAPLQIRKAKKIIVSDWSIYDKNSRAALFILLQELNNKGFELYLWQKDKIVPLSLYEEIFDEREIHIQITPASSQEIYQIALKQYPKFSRDEFFVLDRYWREQFTNSAKLSKDRVLRLTELNAYENYIAHFTRYTKVIKEIYTKIINAESQETPPLSYIVENLDSYPKTLSSDINNFIDNCPVKIFKSYRMVILNTKELRELFLKGHIAYEKWTLTTEQLKYAESLILEGELSQEELNSLLKHVPYLRSLNLEKVTGLPKELQIDTHQLDGITFAPNINYESCNLIFKNNPHLRYLCLSSPLSVNQLTPPDSIKYLQITNTSVLGPSLFHFLQDMTYLQSLEIDSCVDLEKLFPEEKLVLNTLPALGELAIKNTSISSQCLSHLLKASPKLEKLKLSSSTLTDDLLDFEGVTFDKINMITLTSVKLSTSNLLKLLQAAPNLETVVYDGEEPEILELIDIFTTRVVADEPASSPQLPIHKASEKKDFTPHDETRPFQYRGNNKTKNQGMIIEKLSQYLTLKKLHLNMIPKMQDGICAALVSAFSELDKTADGGWDGFINRALNWNGQLNTLSPQLQTDFNCLYEHVDNTYGFGGYNSDPQYYIGEHLEFLLEEDTKLVLSNPWHSILVEKTGTDQWLVYDPNHTQGYQLLNKEDALQLIEQSLGQIIYINHSLIKPIIIKDPNTFIKQGGLFALQTCANTQDLLPQLSPGVDYTKEALEGLLLRNTKGIPAWVQGLKNKQLKRFTFELIQQFIIQNPHTWSAELEKSMACMNANKRHELITKVIQLSNKLSKLGGLSSPNTLLAQQLINTIRIQPSLKEIFARELQTWDNKPKTARSLLSYCQSCFASDSPKKRIIQTDSTEELKSLKYALHQYGHNTQRPVFYVNHPDDLICSAPYTARQEGNKGLVKKGPGGPLYDFLTQNKDNAPVLIVNYEHFNSDDLVGFNGLIDKEQQADGTPLPKETLVLGLINVNKPDCYQGSDFYSRFDTLDHSPVNKAELYELTPSIKQVTEEHDTYVIDFYHGSDWKERLLGQWILNGTELIFREGELHQALASTKTIELKNGPWNDEEFQLFWQEAFLSRSLDNGRLQLPQPLNVLQSEGYNWSNLNHSLELNEDNKDALVLNSSSFNELFTRYLCSNNALISQSGFIEQAANDGFTELAVYLTRELSVDDWARTLTACTKAKIKLKLSVAPGVSLPSEMAPDFQTKAPPEPKSWDGQASNHVIIQSNDISATVATLLKENSKAQVIDISECTPSDLFLLIKGNIQDDPSEFFFTERPSYLEKALAEGQKIILKGQFSQELADALAAHIHQGQDKGQLIIVHDNRATPFAHLARSQHEVSVAEKTALLGDNLPPELEPYLHESYDQLKARLNYPAPIGSDLCFSGLTHIPNALPPLPPFDIKTSAQETQDFFDLRRQQVQDILIKQPYVFLTGLSGVGKTSFVQEELTSPNDALFIGEEKLLDWINSDVKGISYLFIDEANLSKKQWSEFEGLFNTPPTLFHEGKNHRLSPNHKIIFAGNPINYGDERELAPFFAQHGNALIFTPLPPAVIYERTLKPIFADFPDSQIEPVCTHLLKAYTYLCGLSKTDILISPRELQMIALLTRAYYKRHPEADLEQIARHYTYQIVSPLVPQEYKNEFETQYKPEQPLETPNDLPEIKELTITASRQQLVAQINDYLSLRELRLSEATEANPTQLYGGLGGLVLEGAPGVGKSEVVVKQLIAKGYEEISLHTTQIPDKPFYRMRVTMSLAEKIQLLLKAFDEGAVVVIDEINSSPMMERLLNQLLMGKKANGTLPKKPGFMIIGTQNPITMAGRKAPSTALARRLTKVEVADYPFTEIVTILKDKGLNDEADNLASAFLKQVEYAQKNSLNPAPTFRDLLRLAEQVLQGHFQEVKKHMDTLSAIAEFLPLKEVSDKLNEDYLKKQMGLLIKAESPEEIEALGKELSIMLEHATRLSDENLSAQKLLELYENKVISQIEAFTRLDNRFELRFWHAFLNNLITSIKLDDKQTITSSRFILFPKRSKKSKDEAMQNALDQLNLVLAKEDREQIMQQFSELSRIACEQRSSLSALIKGQYSTETQSAHYLLHQFARNEHLLKFLNIEGNNKEKLSLIKEKMVESTKLKHRDLNFGKQI